MRFKSGMGDHGRAVRIFEGREKRFRKRKKGGIAGPRCVKQGCRMKYVCR